MFNLFGSSSTTTFIGAVMDESGSMSSLADDARGSFNTFLKNQRNADVDDDAFLSTFTFDTSVEALYEGESVEEAGELDNDNYTPGGSTALLDAVGECIDTLKKQVEEADEDVDNVVIFIMTDGNENSSKEYSKEDVASKIEEYEGREDVNWEFIFAGAGLDDFTDADNMNIDRDSQFDFDHSEEGLKRVGVAYSASVDSVRSSGSYDRAEVESALNEHDEQQD